MKRAEGLAMRVVHNFVEVHAKHAIKEAQDAAHGKGCRCNTCLHSVAAKANSWVDFLTKGDTPECYVFHVEQRRGKPFIYQGKAEE